jgi:archaemetzincin
LGLSPKSVLVPVGAFPPRLLEALSETTGMAIAPAAVDPAGALSPARRQYDSTRLLIALRERYPEGLVVGATACDLYIPVLTFVFGEAEMPGRAAIFSIHRLREEFYGLPPNPPLLLSRALRELWHEFGHLHGLAHCRDWSCVMSSSHSVERVDTKTDRYCAECRARLGDLPHGA